MEIQGAVIMIGSLYWEDEKNCIQKDLSKKMAIMRKKWRDEKLDMDDSRLIKLPIRYGRKSTSRYCVYTMAFSNSVQEKGQAYCVPYKKKINVSENFNQLYCQALELAEVEGISKGGENTLVKQWGSVGLKLHPKWKMENKEIANKLNDFWKGYFTKLKHNLYRIDESEEHFITKNGILNFELNDNVEDIDYFLATPVSPNIKSYPNGKDIAKAMNDTREGYYSYFIENYNNGIRTYDDEEIIKGLPEDIQKRLNHSSNEALSESGNKDK